MASLRSSRRLIHTRRFSIQYRRSYSTSIDDLQARLTTEMTSRKLPLIFDDLSPVQASMLDVTLQPYLPPDPSRTPESLPITVANQKLHESFSPASHLVYFNPAITAEKLLADGTDPLQSPGGPFTKRMWAGGSLKFCPNFLSTPMAKNRWVCVEGVRDVTVKGSEGDEKVFVGIERRMGPWEAFLHQDKDFADAYKPYRQDNVLGALLRQRAGPDYPNYKTFCDEGEEKIRKLFWPKNEDVWGPAKLIERRNIVFMKEKTPEEASKSAAEKGGGKILKASHPTDLDFTHTLVPDATLLFRYSALTFNAHRIHLDSTYCREVEGHRNLLVHGPLQFTLLTKMLQRHLLEKQRVAALQSLGSGYNKLPWSEFEPAIKSIEYRNLAPVYADEPLKLCGREINSTHYELWAETPEGGMAIRMNAKTEPPHTLVSVGKGLRDQEWLLATTRAAESKVKKYMKNATST